MTVFNVDNTTWLDGNYSLFLGEEPALHDSINRKHQRLHDLYKLAKSLDWSEDEVDLENSRQDLLDVPEEVRELMLFNLAYQWELDSVASRSIAPLFAPFVTNSELWSVMLKNSEIEVLHALTYSEIVRQCVDDPNDVFKLAMQNERISGRMTTIAEAFDKLKTAGAQYTLGVISKDEAYPIVMNAVTALFCLERGQFPVSFSNTFGVVEATKKFQGIATLVAKIFQDELHVHVEMDKEILRIEMATERGAIWRVQHAETIRKMIDEVKQSEYDFADYLFSKEGRHVVGYNKALCLEYVDWCFYDIYETLQFPVERLITKNPLPYMERWANMDSIQVANQEADGANYVLNSVVKDVEDDFIFE